MRFFEELADRVEARLDSHDMSNAALLALQEMPPSEHVSALEVLDWVCESQSLPTQVDLEANFGEPPIVVVNRARLFIQVIFWIDGTTQIHQHGFSGAFSVLEGQSAHVQYLFDAHDSTDPHFVTGRLKHEATEFLSLGDSRAIRRGDGLIHSLFHLARPTVSVVVRSHHDEEAPPQLCYGPTLGIDPFHTLPERTRKIQAFELVLRASPERIDDVFRQITQASDIICAYELLVKLVRSGRPARQLGPLLDFVHSVHGSRSEGFGAGLVDLARRDNIVERRKILVKSDQRMLMALLLTVPDRLGLLRLAGAMKPEVSPIRAVIDGLRDIVAEPVGAVWGPNALGVELGEPAFKFLEEVLGGATIDEASSRVADHMAGQLLALTLPRTTILAPLFR